MKPVVHYLDCAWPFQGAPQAATQVLYLESCHRPDPALPDSAWDSQLPAGPALPLSWVSALFAAEGHVPGRCQLPGRPSENLLSDLFQTFTVL